MNKKRIFILTIIFALFSSTISFAQSQKTFQGSIEYKMEYPDNPSLDVSTMAQLPKTTKAYYGVNHVKYEQSSSMMANTSILIHENGKTNTHLFIEMMGQKLSTSYYDNDKIGFSKAEIEKFEDDTKTIAGYECFKIIAKNKIEGNEISFTIYVTEELLMPEFDRREFTADVPYLPLEIITSLNGINIKQTAIKVKPGKIKNSEFKLLEGYQEMPPEMLGM